MRLRMHRAAMVAIALLVFTFGFASVAFAAISETEPNNTMGTADTAGVALFPGIDNAGNISSSSDVDWWSFPAEGGRTYVITVSQTGSSVDPQAELWLEAQMPDDGNTLIARSDDAYWITMFGSTTTSQIYYTLHDTPAQFGKLHVRVHSAHGTTGAYTLNVSYYTPGPAPASASRLGGSDRYAVAKAVDNARFSGGYGGVANVVVVSGLDKAAADPLTASSLAGALSAPMVLINQDSAAHQLPGYMKTLLSAIKAARGSNPVKFYILGGTASVPDWVKTRIKSIVTQATFERISGSDRYQLASRIAVKTRSISPQNQCFVANGETSAFFFDALAASPIAFRNKWPILLTRKTSVPGSTLTQASHYAEKYVVGNDYEVAHSAIAALGSGTSRYGATGWHSYNRQFVARRLIEYAHDSGWIGVGQPVYTNKLSDALTGGTLAGTFNGPLMYTYSGSELDHSTSYPYTGEWTEAWRFGVTHFWITGGELSVSTGVDYNLRMLTGSTGP